MWLGCLFVSIGCLVAAGILSFPVSWADFSKKRGFTLFRGLIVGVFAANFFMFMPVHISSSDTSVYGIIMSLLLSFLNSIQMFATGCEFSVVKDSIAYCPSWLQVPYQAWASILYVLAPAFAAGFVLSLFKNISAVFRYVFSYNREVYVFSELNEKSLTLAQDIKTNNKKSVIVFTNVSETSEKTPSELIEKAKIYGAILFKKDISVVNFKRHSSAKTLNFFTIGDDENDNLNKSLSLIEGYKTRKNIRIYVFSTKIESSILLSSVDKGLIKVHRVNEVQSLVNRIFYEGGERLFENAKICDNGTKKISAVVVGIGRHGTEMLKALTWYCQMDGYEIEINAFDSDPLAKEKFTALAPELMSPKYNGVMVSGEASYKITVRSGIDISTITFANEIAKINDATYVIVALGNDDININTAINLRMYFERMKIHPVIQAIVYNSEQKKALDGIKNYRGQEYDIEFIGDMESSYTEKVIIDSELENAALKRHLKWGNEEEFWAYEYNYRSSIASAIHLKARQKCGIAGADKKEGDLTQEERDAIEALEHRRWNAYMRAEGYIYSQSKDPSSRNDLAKMHHNLVDFDSLPDEIKRLDSKVGTE